MNKHVKVKKLDNPASTSVVEMPVQLLSIDDVVRLDPLRRPIDAEEVSRLAASIKRDGLRTPIDVIACPKGLFAGKYSIVAGAHRYEACNLIGVTEIPVRILNREQAVGWEQAENLFRHMRALDESESMVRYAKARDLANPGVNRKGGLQPHDKGYSRVAKATRWSHKRVREAFAHDALPSAIKALVRSHKLDNNRQFLTDLSALDTASAQKKMVKDRALTSVEGRGIIANPAVRRPSPAGLSVAAIGRRVTLLEQLWEESPMRKEFENQPVEVRRKFLRWLQA